jgi:6-phosphogluconate dehydrogenase
MKLAMIGLGRMGGSMTERLLNEGHEVVAYAPDAAAVAAAEKRGAIGAHSWRRSSGSSIHRASSGS